MSGGESSSGADVAGVDARGDRGPGVVRRRRAARWALLALVVLGCGWIRFVGLAERGLFGSDVVYYTNLAERWVEGDRVYSLGGRRAVYRPAVLGLFAASFGVLGVEDDSIKRLNAAVDTANVILVSLVVWGLAGRFWPAWTSALVYGLAPLAIFVARLELTHAISTFFMLLTAAAALVWRRTLDGGRPWRRRAALTAAGMASALAALSHEELLFAASGVVAWIAGVAWRRADERRWRAAVAAVLWVTIPLGVGVSGMVAHHAPHAASLIRGTLTSGPSGQKVADPAAGEPAAAEASPGAVAKVGLQVEKTARLLWNAVVATGSVLLAWLFVASLPVAGALALRAPPSDPFRELIALPLLALTTHIVLFALFFPYLFPRLFLPLLPLVLGVVAATADRSLRSRAGALVAAALVVLVLVAGFEQFSRRQAFMQRDYSAEWTHRGAPPAWSPAAAWAELREMSYRTSWARQIHDLLGDRVTPERRLLVTSSLMYPHPARRELQVGYYFGDEAVYLFDHGDSLREVVEAEAIRYVLYTTYRADRRFFTKPEVRHYLGGGRWSEPRPSTLGAPFGYARDDFHLGKEHRGLMDFLRAAGAEPIYATGTFRDGEAPTFQGGDESTVIYELPADWESSVDAASAAEAARRHRSRSRASASGDGTRSKPRDPSTPR